MAWSQIHIETEDSQGSPKRMQHDYFQLCCAKIRKVDLANELVRIDKLEESHGVTNELVRIDHLEESHGFNQFPNHGFLRSSQTVGYFP